MKKSAVLIRSLRGIMFPLSLLAIAACVAFSTASWAAQVSPSALSFSAIQGAPSPAPQSVGFSKVGKQEKAWAAGANMPWVSVTPASGTIATETDTIVIGVNPAGLAAGSYSATVTVTMKGDASQRYTMLPIALVVAAGSTSPPPAIGISSSSLFFNGTAGASNPAGQSITVSNAGGGTLSWSASDNAAWLTISPASGSNTGTVTASVATSGLSVGSYSAVLIITGAGATNTPQTLPVSLTITAAPTPTTATTLPAPTNVVFATGSGQGVFGWVPNPNATTTKLYVHEAGTSYVTILPFSGAVTGTSKVVTMKNGVNYDCWMSSVNTSGVEGPAAGVGCNMPAASAPGTSLATLNWNANAESDLGGYKIYRATASGAYGAAIATVPAGTVSYQANGLAMNTTYFFVITSYDTAGNESSRSNEVSKSIY